MVFSVESKKFMPPQTATSHQLPPASLELGADCYSQFSLFHHRHLTLQRKLEPENATFYLASLSYLLKLNEHFTHDDDIKSIMSINRAFPISLVESP